MPTGWAPSATSGCARRGDWRIGGATGSTYTLGDADVGTLIQVSVSYTDGHGHGREPDQRQTSGRWSTSTTRPRVRSPSPAAATEDQTLTADTSSIADADGLGAFSYQWARSTDGGATWVSIGGATASTYTLGDADVGQSDPGQRGLHRWSRHRREPDQRQRGPGGQRQRRPGAHANTLSIGQGATLILSGANLSASDVDNAAAR